MFNFSRYSCLLRLCLSGMLLLTLCITSYSTVQAEELNVITDSAITFNLRSGSGISTFGLTEDDDENGAVNLTVALGSLGSWNAYGSASDITLLPNAYRVDAWALAPTPINADNNKVRLFLIYKMKSGANLLDKGQSVELTTDGITFYMSSSTIINGENQGDNKEYFIKTGYKPYSAKLIIYGESGERVDIIDDFDYEFIPTGSGSFTVNFEIPPQEFNVKSVEFVPHIDLSDAFNVASNYFNMTYYPTGEIMRGVTGYMWIGVNNGRFVITEVDESIGLLGGIIDWIKGIYNATIGLPAKVGQAIGDWIVSLFTPDQDVISSLKTEWDNLLKERFGLVYEAGTIINGVFNGIMVVSEQEYIEIPEVTLDFAGSEFTFGGYQVRIIPEGFEFLQTLVKMMIDICVSILFINAMRKTYDRIFGG